MSHRRVSSASSILSILSCSSDEFTQFFDGEYKTSFLVEDARKVISHNRQALREASQDRYHLDELLLGMLDHAPGPSGQRYVAIVLHIANQKGSDAVIDAVKAWLDHLFFPMWTLSSKTTKTVPSSSQTPTFNDTAVQIQAATRLEQGDFRAAIAAREQYRCAITKDFDFARARELMAQGKEEEVPASPQMRNMQAAHIIPFPLNKFSEDINLVSRIFFVLYVRKKDAAYTWDMLHAWTGLDLHELMGSNINSPKNGIYMNDVDHFQFGRFLFYFDKDEYPNSPTKYKIRMARRGWLANGAVSVDVEFLENAGVPPPNPQFLKIHAAFAKVLARSEVAAYMQRVEMSNQRGAPTDPNAENDFATLLRSKLLASAP